MLITQETPEQPEVQVLLELADARSASLYPEESRFGSSIADLIANKVRFFVAREAGHALGCGGYAVISHGIAELKRIFVINEARGHGVGRRIIEAIERAAIAEGIGHILLETGVKSTEAIRLYRRLNYTERGPYGDYGPDPLCVFMEKSVADA